MTVKVLKYEIKSKYGQSVILLHSEKGTKAFQAKTAHDYIVNACFEGNDPFLMSFDAKEQKDNLKNLLSMLNTDTHEVLSELYNDAIEIPVFQTVIAKLISVTTPTQKTVYKGMRKFKAATYQVRFDGGISGYLTTEPDAPLTEGVLYSFEMSCFFSRIEIKNIRSYENQISSLQKQAA